MDRPDGTSVCDDLCRFVVSAQAHTLDPFVTGSQWSKSGDTRWYLGVRCRKCKTPILFGLDRSEGSGDMAPAGKLVLTCSKPTCRHQADYSGAKVSRFQKTLHPR
jgi:hypothetical protein